MQANYIGYLLEMKSGDTITGILQAESADAVVLIQPFSQYYTAPRKEILSLQATGLSLMPEGLESGMTPADLRDLIAFLQADR